jgi:hypothetical protein
MKNPTLTIPARITPNVFSEFSRFDTMTRRKLWRRPLIFAAIFTAFALVCFSQYGKLAQAGLMGGVLLAVGLGLPFVYILSFYLSVRTESKRLKLKGAPVAYTVALSDLGITVTSGTQQVSYPWAEIRHVYRIVRSTCLYVQENQAFLLPRGEERAEEKLWNLLCTHIPEEKRIDLRRS